MPGLVVEAMVSAGCGEGAWGEEGMVEGKETSWWDDHGNLCHSHEAASKRVLGALQISNYDIAPRPCLIANRPLCEDSHGHQQVVSPYRMNW